MKFSGLFLFLLFLIFPIFLFSQNDKKVIQAVRAGHSPKIDGHLNDECWKAAIPACEFIQFEPYNGEYTQFKTVVSLVYDDKAIYIGAKMYDNSPDSILKQYSPRDEINISDFFGVQIDPFNNGLGAYAFYVTPVNIQMDTKLTDNGPEDSKWNAVWASKTSKEPDGWVAELKIPYSALRFPKSDVQLWGINFIRKVERHREKSTWSFIDKGKPGMIRQQGELTGIGNITPPVRLSFTPFVSTYLEKDPLNEHWTNLYRAGLDVKYGINESFTLDMMLVPDFGQVQSDQVVLNLSPFEISYDEKRQFFIEGGELFNRADIFYSRRIGAMPKKFGMVSKQLSENEKIIKNPSETQLINATKISGRTKGGFGIGFLNAMSLNTHAIILDTISGFERLYLTQPFTNYNLISFDKALKNNSFISLINTNVARHADNYYANVTGSEFYFNNKSKTYAFSGSGAVSQIWDNASKPALGYTSFVRFAKTSGFFRFSYSNLIESDTYNPNDLGFLRNNNEISNSLSFSYLNYKPFWRLLSWRNTISFWQQSLYNPLKNTAFEVNGSSFATFRNHLTLGVNLSSTPFSGHDYFEARVAGRKFIRPATLYAQVFFSTDFRKKLAMDFSIGSGPKNAFDGNSLRIRFTPRYRPNDKTQIVFSSNFTKNFNNVGFVSKSADNSVIYFGKRDFTELANTLEGRYIFTEKASLMLNLRHYWSTVRYLSYFTLNPDGSLATYDAGLERADINFNFFTLNLSYQWIFAPGSEISIVWKNTINTESNLIETRYFRNVSDTFKNPQTNSFSIKVLYYLDYLYLKRKHN
jgi:hypothetical protein